MTVTLRPATAKDAAAVADILLRSRAAFLPYAPSPHSDDQVRAWVREHLLPCEHVTIATVAGRASGVLAMHREPAITWITQLYLLPAFVGLGIGTLLLAHALATAAPPIRLHTFQQNAGARRFYERNGFVPIQFTDGAANEERCPDVLYERIV